MVSFGSTPVFSIRSTSPGATRYCFPPVRITAYIKPPQPHIREPETRSQFGRIHAFARSGTAPITRYRVMSQGHDRASSQGLISRHKEAQAGSPELNQSSWRPQQGQSLAAPEGAILRSGREKLREGRSAARADAGNAHARSRNSRRQAASGRRTRTATPHRRAAEASAEDPSAQPCLGSQSSGCERTGWPHCRWARAPQTRRNKSASTYFSGRAADLPGWFVSPAFLASVHSDTRPWMSKAVAAGGPAQGGCIPSADQSLPARCRGTAPRRSWPGVARNGGRLACCVPPRASKSPETGARSTRLRLGSVGAPCPRQSESKFRQRGERAPMRGLRAQWRPR